MLRSKKGVTRRRVLRGLLGLGVGTFTGTGVWGYCYERHRIVANRQMVPVAGLPPALQGVRIALLTDVHWSETASAGVVAEAVALAREASPDLVVLGGDYISWGDRRFAEPAAEALTGLTATAGVFAVLGNHDDERDMPAALARRGYQVLRDARTTIRLRGERVTLIGLRFWTRRVADIHRVVRDAAGFPILLAHDPRRLADAAGFGIPLVLSGHTHGGQVRLPLVSALATRRFPVVAGIGVQQDATLFVSSGIGTVYVPMRVNCPPEVAILTLTTRGAGGHGPGAVTVGP